MPKFRFVYQELEEYIGDLEGNQIDISEDGLILIQKLNHITNQEMEEFYNGNLAPIAIASCNSLQKGNKSIVANGDAASRWWIRQQHVCSSYAE